MRLMVAALVLASLLALHAPPTLARVVDTDAPKATKDTRPRVNFDFVHADLIYVLKLLARSMHMNLVTDNSVKGTVTMELRDVPAEGALQLVLKLNGYNAKVVDHTIVVGLAETLDKIPADIFAPRH